MNICNIGGEVAQQRKSAAFVGMGQAAEVESNGDPSSLLVREMNALSVREREGVYAEIHGVNDDMEETPELLEQSLHEFREALRRLPRKTRRLYDTVLFLRPGLEKDDQFMLLFLRAAYFVVKDAVHKILRHFECKHYLFGPEKIAKDITMSDMSDEDLAHFRAGGLRLEGTDSSGRTILFNDYRCMLGDSYESALRFMFYIQMNALKDRNTQKCGILYVVWCVGLDEAARRTAIAYLSSTTIIENAVPLRQRALHFAYDDPKLRPLVYAMHLVVGRNLRLRFRSHLGSELEIKYALMSYGISLNNRIVGLSAVDFATEKGTQYALDSTRRDEEDTLRRTEAEKTTGLILVPTMHDCLVGRGKSYQEYVGNLKLSKILDQYKDRYSRSSERLDKTVVALAVMKTVEEYGGRFLQRVDMGWQVADVVSTQHKVTQALRFRVRKAEEYNEHTYTALTFPGPELTSSTPLLTRDSKRMKLGDV